MATIEIRLDALARLYDSLDPAPFHDKSLDRDAEAWLIESADEVSPREPLELLVRGPESLRASVPEIAAAVHAHFRRALEHQEWMLRRRIRVSRLVLLIGLGVLAATLIARHLLLGGGERSGVVEVLGEGLLVVGWVAMWRPVELLLYEPLESAAARAVLRRLSQATVGFCPLDDPEAAAD
ncbi:MAG: hypothetical protein J0L89_00460 [Xanthomonadales bacterium]|nr:hypothetical protein [Xanthomonadales bacterium]